MEGEAQSASRDEERRRYRPYRRFIVILFVLATVSLSGAILIGIISTLDRLPAADDTRRPKVVDARALRACATDLEQLERRIRQKTSRLFAEPSRYDARPSSWASFADPFERERLAIVGRCRLDESSDDTAHAELARAASEIEAVLRAFGLLFARHLADGFEHSHDARRAISNANALLEAR